MTDFVKGFAGSLLLAISVLIIVVTIHLARMTDEDWACFLPDGSCVMAFEREFPRDRCVEQPSEESP